MGQVHPAVAAKLGIEGDAFLFELDVLRLLPAVTTPKHRAIPRFPAVVQDLSLLVDASVPAERVTALLRGSELVAAARLFDVYEGPPLPAGKRSLAYALHFQAADRTLTDAEVAEARSRITWRLERELSAEVRGA
jgi:phenylalanyl-tRNA synthetase beta chain